MREIKEPIANRIQIRYREQAHKKYILLTFIKESELRMQRPFLWSKPSPAVRISQPRPRRGGRPVSSEPPTPPPRGQSRGIIKYKYTEPPSAPAPLMSRPPRLHRYPSVSFDLSPAPSSRGSSLIVDLWLCLRWPQCPLSLVLCLCCPSCPLLAFQMKVSREGFYKRLRRKDFSFEGIFLETP